MGCFLLLCAPVSATNTLTVLHVSPVILCAGSRNADGTPTLFSFVLVVRESRIFVETSKSRPTHARLRNRELADEAELVSLSVG